MLKKTSSLVIDTHVWLWIVQGDPRAAVLQQHVGRMSISAISIWEIGMLVEKKRLNLKPNAKTWVNTYLKLPFILQPLSTEIALRSMSLPGFHGDPADRMVVSSSLKLGFPLVTADRIIQKWYRAHPELEQLIIPL